MPSRPPSRSWRHPFGHLSQCPGGVRFSHLPSRPKAATTFPDSAAEIDGARLHCAHRSASADRLVFALRPRTNLVGALATR